MTLAVLAPIALLPRAAPAIAADSACGYPNQRTPERWMRLPEATPAMDSVGQLDRDACTLVGTTKTGAVRSVDAGRTWVGVAAGQRLGNVHTEGLQLAAGGTRTGPVLANEPARAPAGGPPQVMFSADDGLTFNPSRLSNNASSQLRLPLTEKASLQGELLAAVSVAEFSPQTAGQQPDNGPMRTVLLVARMNPAAGELPGGGLPSTGVEVGRQTVLLRSVDAGESFEPLTGPSSRALTPTTVAVNPTDPKEIWLNNLGPRHGAWRSLDGGQTFTMMCCPDVLVRDVVLAPTAAGGVDVLLASELGLMRSHDDGATWTTIQPGSVTAVRTAPDDANMILIQTADQIVRLAGPKLAASPLDGAQCVRPSGLRRTATTPPTFLAECDGVTHRLTLTSYRTVPTVTSGTEPGNSGPGGVPCNFRPCKAVTSRSLRELRTIVLPDANPGSGLLGFDGRQLYYDKAGAGQAVVGAVDAQTGAPVASIDLTERLPPGGDGIVAITVDQRRNELILETRGGNAGAAAMTPSRPYTFELSTGRLRPGGGSRFYPLASHDGSFDGWSFVREYSARLVHEPRTGPLTSCNLKRYSPSSEVPSVSAFAAAGDGGGYVQDEDDSTIYRVDAGCRTGPPMTHRQFSESPEENDTLVCDTQTFFPSPAIWIRDSAPGTVTAYGVPFGYCPLPSRLAVTAPTLLAQGQTGPLCAHLINQATGRPAQNKFVEISVDAEIVGRGETDAYGDVCVTYTAASGAVGGRRAPVAARFAGDSALFPSTAAGSVTIGRAALPPAPHLLAAAPPVPPPPPIPVIPPQPVVNPGPVPAPNPAPAPAQAPAAQAQPVSQAAAQPMFAVAPQRQQQAQLALAVAFDTVANTATGEQPMSAIQDRHRDGPVPAAAIWLLGAMMAAPLARACGYQRRSG